MFWVNASDQDPDDPRSTTAAVTVMVEDINDNYPTCSQSFYQFQILSSAAANSLVGRIDCSDADSGNNAILMYEIVQPANTFNIDANGQISLQNGNNLNSSSSVLVNIIVSDRGDPSLSVSVTASVRVVFGNVAGPAFIGLPYQVLINENTQLLDTVFQLRAIDSDSNTEDLRYRLLNDASNTFYVNPNTGSIALVRPVDYESRQSYNITVSVSDSGSHDGNNILTDTAMVEINIENLNDNSPMFDNGAYGTIIPQSEPVNSRIINGSCTDDDLGTFGDVTVTWDGMSPFELMLLNSGTFTVRIAEQSLSPGSFVYNVTCSDAGRINSTAMVYISVRAPPDPEFSNTRYEWLLREDANISTNYATISATSPNNDNPIVYSFVDDSDHFGINPSTGVVSLTQTLDYESQTQFGLIVRATDGLNRFTDVLLLVRVLDVNDQLPLVPPSAVLSINHSHPVNAPFAFIRCSDGDVEDRNSQFNFTFDPPSNLFFIDDVGVVYLIGILDLTPVYALPVTCFNVETPEVRSVGVVTINVIFNNLYQPRFEFQIYHINASENAMIGDEIITPLASDNDVGIFGELSYSILEGDQNNHFFINSSSGEIKVLLNLDRERIDLFNLTVAAVDGGLTASPSSRRTGMTLVHIFVSDYNDNPPMFDESLYRFNITTTTPRNSLIGNVMCVDPDEGRNMEISYSLMPVDTYYFSINRSGAIFLLEEHSTPDTYTLTVVCNDNGSPQLSSTAVLSIIVRLEDPEAPVFNQSLVEVTVNETITFFTRIASLSATSNDFTLEIRYYIVSGNVDNKFRIDQATGELYNVQLLDAELVDEYSLTIEANYTEYLSAISYATVVVQVLDINDNAPYFVPSPLYSTMILEAVGPREVLRVSCMDNDTITDISYSIAAGNVNQIFGINSAGAVFSTRAIDYEQISSYTLTITCSDGRPEPRSATAQAVVAVIPQNDHAPQFSMGSYSFSVDEDAELGMVVGTISATDGDSGPHGFISYSIITAPPFDAFFVHPTTGVVQVSGTLDYEAISVYQMSVSATDGYVEGPVAVPLVVSIQDVNDNDPVIRPQVLIREIEHNTSANTVVGHFDCSDTDSVNSQGTLAMNITSGNERGWFALEADGDIVWSGTEVNINSAVISTIIVHCYDDGNRRSDPAHFTGVVYPAGQLIPQFVPSNIYITSVNEHSPLNTSVITITTASSSAVQYSIAGLTNDNLPFVINSVTGVIQVSADIDYAVQQSYNFVVVANDTTNSLSNAAAVRITIDDINDNVPQFQMDAYQIPLPENLLVPAYIATIVCTDEDTNDNTEVSLLDENNIFSISSSGVLSVMSPLDYESRRSHQLLLRCTDGTNEDSSLVNIIVTPANEYPPVFTNLPYMMTLMESNQTFRNIITVSASDNDQVNGADITYRLIANAASVNFQINATSGVIQNRQPLLVVDQTHYTLEVIATDGGLPNVFTSTALVIVEVTDVNEPPRLLLDSTEVLASTASASDTILLNLQCIDNDLNQNAELQFSYQISFNPGVDIRTISSVPGMAIGQLYVNTTLQMGNYMLTVTCIDMGISPLSTSEEISIQVISANAEAPEFLNSSYVVSIYENVTVNTLLITVLATDPLGVTYQIEDGNEAGHFFIIPSNGSIFIQMAVDADFGPDSYNLSVVATDLAPTQPLSATTTVNILVIGINDHDPEISPGGDSFTDVPETAEINVYQVRQYTCTDIDGSTTMLSIAMTGNINSTFQAVQESGYVVLQRPLDYEIVPQYILTILCIDEATAIAPSRTASAMLTIRVDAVNIHAPVFTNDSFYFSVAERSPPGTVVGTIAATDADNRAMSVIRYSIGNSMHSSAFFIGSSSGEIITTANFNDSVPVYNIMVVASDEDPLVTSRSSTVSVTVTISDVNDNRPVCTEQVIELLISQTVFSSNTSIVNITCSDQDIGINSLLTYSFNSLPSNAFGIRTLNDMIGEVVVSGTVNPGVYVLVVNVSDRGTVPLSELVHVIINVQRALEDRLQFSNPFFRVNVSENIQASSIIFDGSNFNNSLVNRSGSLQYSIVVNGSSKFSINGLSGDIRVLEQLDYESITRIYTIIIDVEDDSGAHAIGSLSVYVTNFNDERPEFSQSEYNFSVFENQNPGALVGTVVATDIDFGPVLYQLSTDTNDFAIDSVTGVITTLRELDSERELFTRLLQVNATDSGNPQLFSLVNVYVSILDINDNPPAFNQTQYSIFITNVSPAGRLIVLMADDPDSTSVLQYSIDDDSGLFSIDPTSGALQLIATVPPIHQDFYQFMAFVSDGSNSHNASILVQVFDVTVVLLSFEETEIIGAVKFNITDYLISTGSVITSFVTYEILFGNTNTTFIVSDGNITNVKPLDRESIDGFEMILEVNGTSSQTNVFLSIDISDINDNAPVFSEPVYIFNVTESHYVSPYELGQIQATDQDAGINSRISFEIENKENVDLPFRLRSTTGGNVLFTAIGGIDREVVSQYNLTIIARDFAPTNSLSSSVVALINVIDINDNAPMFVNSDVRTLTAVLDTPAGYRLLTLTATDADAGTNGEISFTMNATKDSFDVTRDFHLEEITTISGEVHLITDKTIGLDSHGTVFKITISDNGSQRVYVERDITITLTLEVRNADPQFTSPVYTGQVQQNSRNKTVLEVTAIDGDFGNSGQVEYRLLQETSGIFVIDPLKGIISIGANKIISDLPPKRYEFNVEAVDRAPQPGSDTTFVIIDIFRSINVLNIHTCQPYERFLNITFREEFRLTVETLVKQQQTVGSLFIERFINLQQDDGMLVTVVSVYMIAQDNFYQNWTSATYTSVDAARTLLKSFYNAVDIINFLNNSLQQQSNETKDYLCITNLNRMTPPSIVEDSTTWPESTTGIAVITVAAFLLVALLFCLICCICVCCLREEKEKDPFVHVAKRVHEPEDLFAVYPPYGHSTVWPGYGYHMDDGEEFSHDDPESRMLYEHRGQNEMMTTFINDQESDFNDDTGILQQSNTDVSVVTSDNNSTTRLQWGMGPYLKEVLEKFQEGESLLTKHEHKKRQKRSKN